MLRKQASGEVSASHSASGWHRQPSAEPEFWHFGAQIADAGSRTFSLLPAWSTRAWRALNARMGARRSRPSLPNPAYLVMPAPSTRLLAMQGDGWIVVGEMAGAPSPEMPACGTFHRKRPAADLDSRQKACATVCLPCRHGRLPCMCDKS